MAVTMKDSKLDDASLSDTFDTDEMENVLTDCRKVMKAYGSCAPEVYMMAAVAHLQNIAMHLSFIAHHVAEINERQDRRV